MQIDEGKQIEPVCKIPVRVLLFAGLRDLAGTSALEITIPKRGFDASLLVSVVGSILPQCVPLLPSCRIARNGGYASLQDTVFPGDEIAILPPVSGG